ncbi:VanZ family protein [Kitasatospora sp. CB01950]|uniref:VanZ family protein n=1 Tax=Kitasatospora sp. CB01950 TaxID=1703930 RepID=UPI001F52AA79|nr:VanZ family protein [Kitasatospora sp. CB01950]
MNPVPRARRIALFGPALLLAAAVAFVAQRPLHHRAGWQPWLVTINAAVFWSLAALPLSAAVVWALARRRGGTADGWRRSVAEVAMVHGTLPWVWMIMLPGPGAGVAPRRVSLLPLRDIHAILTHGTPVTATVQIVGNLLVFAALGRFAPIRFRALASVPRMLALGAACSVLVETAQYVLWLDRVSSVDDVLLNAAGAGLAAWSSRRRWSASSTSARSPRPPAPAAPRGPGRR